MFQSWLQTLAVVVGVAGGLVAIFHLVFEMRSSTKQRESDLRWRRANSAKELMTDIHRDQRACSAVTMMDWSDGGHEYDLAPGLRLNISYRDVLTALSKPPSECSQAADQFVRDAFDWFFYYMDRIEHYIETGLIDFADVSPVFKPYAKLIHQSRPIYDAFIAFHAYDLAPNFLRRYGTS